MKAYLHQMFLVFFLFFSSEIYASENSGKETSTIEMLVFVLLFSMFAMVIWAGVEPVEDKEESK